MPPPSGTSISQAGFVGGRKAKTSSFLSSWMAMVAKALGTAARTVQIGGDGQGLPRVQVDPRTTATVFGLHRADHQHIALDTARLRVLERAHAEEIGQVHTRMASPGSATVITCPWFITTARSQF